MKIPGLFGKTSNYHRFEYKPRYFDPRKEEYEAREERIRRELALEKKDDIRPNETEYDYRARMKGAFQTARRRSSSKGDESNAAILRLAILLIIALFLFAFFQWGSKVVYGLFLVFPVWIYFRFFKKKKTEE